MKIYLVEDDNNIRELVIYTLKQTGFEALGFSCAGDFWAVINAGQLPDLVLLDIMLPDEDGLTILRKLRILEATKHLPIVMLTAKSGEYDKVMGLDSGADDYIPKPFGMMELVARIKALLRRSGVGTEAAVQVCEIGMIRLDTERHQVYVADTPVVLTHKEFELLYYLMKNKGIVLQRGKILSRIWGYDFDGETRTVDVHIRMLRQKLGEAGSYIETVRGVGYKIEVPV